MVAHSSLVAAYGTPLYVYDLAEARLALAGLREALPAGAAVYYSLKANPHPLLALTLRSAGARAEVSSLGELDAAREAGFTGDEILYTGPGKTEGEIRAAVRVGVRTFSVESEADYRRVARTAADAGTTAECLVRVNPPTVAGGSLRFAGRPSQFGVDLDALLAEPERFADRPGATVVGAHLFPVSNMVDEEALVAQLCANAAAAGRLRKETGLRMVQVDLGGGFSAPFAQPGERPRYRPAMRTSLEAALDDNLPGWGTGDVGVAFESGRHLAGGCGVLVSRVTEVKRSGAETFLLLDSGINHLGGMTGLGRTLPMDARLAQDAPPGEAVATLAGPLCMHADVLGRQVPVGPVAAGDLVTIPNVGAYGMTASLVAFLSRPLPVEVVVDGGELVDASRVRLVREPVEE